MRILIISNYYPPIVVGGWEQLTEELVNQLENRGHDLFVLTSNYKASTVNNHEPKVARVLHLDSYDHVRYHPLYTINRFWNGVINKKKLSKVLGSIKPDVVFIHGMWNMPKGIAWHAERLLPGKVVYYIASTWPTEDDPHLRYWRLPAKRAFRKIPKRIIGHFIQRLLIKRPHECKLDFEHVICVSEFIQRYMIEEAGVLEENTTVIYNGIDIKQFAIKKKERFRNRLKLLYAGGLLEHKGVHTGIEAVGYLVNELGETDIELTMVGSGPLSYVNKLHELIQQFNLGAYTSFGEFVSRERMPQLLCSHDVLIFPSIGPEAFARIVQEAMACELVVIGSTAGGTPELIQNYENGLTFTAGNAHELAEKIIQVKDDLKMYERLCAMARKTIEDHFTVNRMVDEIERYILKINGR